jgi:hypothetical protein
MTDEPAGRAGRDLKHEMARLAESGPREEAFRSKLKAELAAEAARLKLATASPPQPAFQPGKRRRTRRRILVGLVAAAVVTGALLVGLGRAGGPDAAIGPTPAEAQTILHAAAALKLGRGEVGHYVYRVTISGIGVKNAATGAAGGSAVTGTTSVWFARPEGKPVVSAQDITISKGGTPLLLSRYVQVGGQRYGYDGSHDMILLPFETHSESLVLPSAAFDTGSLAQSLQAALASNGAQVRSITRQTLDGRAVDAIGVDGAFGFPAMRATFYFDAGTHALRGFDAASNDPSYPTPSWTVRLASSQVMAAASVPAGTFLLNAPADARVQPPVPDKQALLRLLPGLKVQKPGMGILQAIQAAHPGMSEDAVIAALFGSSRGGLDAAVAAGQITAAQAASAVQLERMQITVPVAPLGGSSPVPMPSATAQSS